MLSRAKIDVLRVGFVWYDSNWTTKPAELFDNIESSNALSFLSIKRKINQILPEELEPASLVPAAPFNEPIALPDVRRLSHPEIRNLARKAVALRMAPDFTLTSPTPPEDGLMTVIVFDLEALATLTTQSEGFHAHLQYEMSFLTIWLR